MIVNGRYVVIPVIIGLPSEMDYASIHKTHVAAFKSGGYPALRSALKNGISYYQRQFPTRHLRLSYEES